MPKHFWAELFSSSDFDLAALLDELERNLEKISVPAESKAAPNDTTSTPPAAWPAAKPTATATTAKATSKR